MALSVKKITEAIAQMNEGDTEFYNLDQFASQADLDQAYEFLTDNRFNLEIEVGEHKESQSGNDNIDMIIVTKR